MKDLDEGRGAAMSFDTRGLPRRPYVGPVSFRLGDALYGRDRERQDLSTC